MTRVAIYTRVSLDRDGTKESPETQEVACRDFCASRNWEVAEVFCDRNASGFKRGVRREEFERMMTAVRERRVEGVVAYKLDRLTRGGITGIAGILDDVRSAGGLIAFVHDHVDTSTALGEGFLGLLASQAKQESQNISTRVSDAHAAAARAGKMHGGGSRTFGYRRPAKGSYGGIDEDEAAIVRECAARIVAGESLRKIAFDLNARGIKTSMGKQWRSNTLAQMIQSPRLAGLRTHRGDLHAGTWPAILSLDERTKLLDALARPLAQRRSVRRHLLSGYVTCGKCGGGLKTMGFRLKNGKPFERYQCVKQPGEVNCGGVAVAKNSLDRFVIGEFLDFMARSELRPLPDDARLATLELEIEADRESLRDLTKARFVDRLIGDDEFVSARRLLEERVDRSELEAQAIRRHRDLANSAIRPGSREDLAGWWEQASISDRRAALGTAFTTVRIMPARHRGGNQFDTTRVAIKWRWDLFVRAADQWAATATDGQWEAAEAEYLQLVRDEVESTD